MYKIVYFPITCPLCLTVTLVPYTRAEIDVMLISGEPITLYSPCHNYSWTASNTDRAGLRDVAMGLAAPEPKYPEGRQPEIWEQEAAGPIDWIADGSCSFLPATTANN